MIEISSEQEALLEIYVGMPLEVMSRRIDNERFLIKSQVFWLNKYLSFQKDPEVLQRNIDDTTQIIERCRSKIKLMEVCRSMK